MNLLALKTFFVVAIMLITTAFAAKRNQAFETKFEFWGLFIGGIILLLIVPSILFPYNLVLTLGIAFLIGSLIGPGIKGMMLNYVFRKTLQKEGYSKEGIKNLKPEEIEAKLASVKTSVDQGGEHPIIRDWNKIFQLAIYSTSLITIISGTIVYTVEYDFSFLGTFLLVALVGLIVIGLLNTFFFKSAFLRLIGAYIGAVIFSLYLLFDFSRLEKSMLAGDVSWETAVNYGISIYLDIVNLFLDLLEILSSD